MKSFIHIIKYISYSSMAIMILSCFLRFNYLTMYSYPGYIQLYGIIDCFDDYAFIYAIIMPLLAAVSIISFIRCRLRPKVSAYDEKLVDDKGVDIWSLAIWSILLFVSACSITSAASGSWTACAIPLPDRSGEIIHMRRDINPSFFSDIEQGIMFKTELHRDSIRLLGLGYSSMINVYWHSRVNERGPYLELKSRFISAAKAPEIKFKARPDHFFDAR
ncbi:MAG: hypothetical protein PHT33_05665 [bacterium]|nr:hypothetical protein [bacterium]